MSVLPSFWGASGGDEGIRGPRGGSAGVRSRAVTAMQDQVPTWALRVQSVIGEAGHGQVLRAARGWCSPLTLGGLQGVPVWGRLTGWGPAAQCGAAALSPWGPSGTFVLGRRLHGDAGRAHLLLSACPSSKLSCGPRFPFQLSCCPVGLCRSSRQVQEATPWPRPWRGGAVDVADLLVSQIRGLNFPAAARCRIQAGYTELPRGGLAGTGTNGSGGAGWGPMGGSQRWCPHGDLPLGLRPARAADSGAVHVSFWAICAYSLLSAE